MNKYTNRCLKLVVYTVHTNLGQSPKIKLIRVYNLQTYEEHAIILKMVNIVNRLGDGSIKL